MAEYPIFFLPHTFLFSLSADEYKVFMEQREEKLKADAAAAAAAAAEALSGKKKWRPATSNNDPPHSYLCWLYTSTTFITNTLLMLCMSDHNKQSIEKKKRIFLSVFVCLKKICFQHFQMTWETILLHTLHLGIKNNNSHFENIYDPERFISTEPN